ncbi:MAG: glycosyltransferase family 4 protein [Saprospiraceae bacterium]|nr:glycosyltransferase family 4 protein [Saprospiraceae bacterium]
MKQIIIYIYPSLSTFIVKDIELLSKEFFVISPNHNWSIKLFTPLRFFQQLFFLIKHTPSCLNIFVMFGGYWSILPVLVGRFYNKPVYIILGGTDCVSFPSINYGSLRKPLLKHFIKWSYQLSTKLIPVDESLVYCNYSYYENSIYKHQGYKYFFPQISTPHQVIYNGFDSDFFSGIKINKILNSFICVASISDKTRFKLKGIDIILKLALVYQHCTFTVIGISETMVNSLKTIPQNVNLYPFLPQNEIKNYLMKSEYVVQLSISEGFPNSLCEAMLCKCIPIGSSVGAIPRIIGDSGYIIEKSDLEYIIKKFNSILKTNKNQRLELGEKARNRIINCFNLSAREKEFMKLIKSSK